MHQPVTLSQNPPCSACSAFGCAQEPPVLHQKFPCLTWLSLAPFLATFDSHALEALNLFQALLLREAKSIKYTFLLQKKAVGEQYWAQQGKAITDKVEKMACSGLYIQAVLTHFNENGR